MTEQREWFLKRWIRRVVYLVMNVCPKHRVRRLWIPAGPHSCRYESICPECAIGEL